MLPGFAIPIKEIVPSISRMSQQPPKQGHYGYQGRQQAPQQNVGAWQPAAPTSQQTQQQQQQCKRERVRNNGRIDASGRHQQQQQQLQQ